MKQLTISAYKHAWDLVENKKLIRRVVLFWFLMLVAFATWMVFDNMDKVNASVATVYGSLIALNGMIFGFYFHGRKNDTPNGS